MAEEEEDLFGQSDDESPASPKVANSAGNSNALKRKVPKQNAGSENSAKRSKSDVASYFDNEAEESGEDGDEDADDGAEEPVVDDYVRDGFVVDEDEEGDTNNIKPTSKAKKDFTRLKKKKEVRLEDEDLDLIAENTKDREKADVSNEIVPERVRPSVSRATDGELFDEEDDYDIRPSVPGRVEEPDDDGYDSEDMNDFLVDDLGEGLDGDDGEGISRGPSSARNRGRKSIHDGPSRSQLDEAMDIFGDGFEDYMNEDGGDEDRDEQHRDTGDKDVSLKTKIASVRSQYERTALIESFCTEKDDFYRQTDRPERLLYTMVDRSAVSEEERRIEASWMSRRIDIDDLNLEELGQDEEQLREEWREPIQYVLRLIQVTT